jgi:hypothetical protein
MKTKLLKVGVVVSSFALIATIGGIYWATKLPTPDVFGALSLSLIPQGIGLGILLGEAKI